MSYYKMIKWLPWHLQVLKTKLVKYKVNINFLKLQLKLICILSRSRRVGDSMASSEAVTYHYASYKNNLE